MSLLKLGLLEPFQLVMRGIFALFFRSLRVDARAVRIHLIWFLLAAVVYVALCVTQQMSVWYGAPGLRFFRYLAYVDVAFITFLGIGFFASAISEEKEENTLGLMTMAGISPLSLLLGKSTTRVLQVLLLLAIQYPATLLAITLGGLTRDQINSVNMALLAYTMLLANVALLCSVLCRRTRDAAGLTLLWLVAYGALPHLGEALLTHLSLVRGWSGVNPLESAVLTGLRWSVHTGILTELETAAQTGYTFRWSVQIVSNGLGGILCFLLSWIALGFVSKDPQPETASRGMVARRTSRARWLFGTGRVWSWSLAWKDFHFSAGGWAGVWIRCLLYGGVYASSFGVMCYVQSLNPGTQAFRWNDVTWGFYMMAIPLWGVDISLCMARTFQEEIKDQTLAALLMLPQSNVSVVYSKLAGSVIGLLPGALALGIGYIVLPLGYWRFDARNAVFATWLISHLFLFAHLSLVLSTYFRWAALGLAFCWTLGWFALTVFVVESTKTVGMVGFSRMDIQTTLFLIAAAFVLFVCLLCHVVLVLRMRRLGEQ